MIKKTVIFSMLILFCFSAFAQNKMDKATFEHLVDYANCQYLMAFIEKNDEGKPYIKDTYVKIVNPVLQTAKIDNLNKAPDFTKIKGLFSIVPNNSALKLATKINERKGKYESSPDNISLAECLKADKWQGDKGTIDLNSTATKIQNSIRTKFKASQTQQTISITNQESIKNKSVQTSSLVDTLQTKIANLEQQYDTLQNNLKISQGTISSLGLLVILSFVFIVLLVVIISLWYIIQFNAENRNSSVRQFVKNVFLTSEEIKGKIENTQNVIPVNEGKNNVRKIEDKLNNLERQVSELQLKSNSNKTLENQNTGNQNTTTQTETQTIKQSSNSSLAVENGLFFASKSNKQLSEKLPNSINASFKVFEINGNEADFEYVGVVRNENWFEGVCLIENSANDNLSDKKQISSTQPGKVRKENDNWIVIAPAKIKFI